MAPSDDTATRRSGIPGKALVIHFLIAGAPPLLAAWASGIEPESHWSELGAGLAMISGAVFFLQFWSSGRFETLSGSIGIDRTMGFHRIAAVVALLVAIAHPLAPLVPVFLDRPRGFFVLLSEMIVRLRRLSGVLSLAGLSFSLASLCGEHAAASATNFRARHMGRTLSSSLDSFCSTR